ncbi:hypothetical protein [Cytobacillus purgationiresistens]|uniref:DUF3139 domain-containing protein n=1 Tax=Cytobacillus purgationiresistens TaxID=863449 RepID=A0ABU0AGH8_9BACI|nr:hypothetical protein [Cytobacillus purgationiresistens]MDQ0270361.1 hypothetical protein [Cytobacillus purgationiresistens]
MKRKKAWIILAVISFVLFLRLSVIGFLFKDDGSISGFVTDEGKEEYVQSYNEAMNFLPQPVESKIISTDFGEVQLYKFQEDETPNKHLYCYFPEKGLRHPWGKQISMIS